MIKVEQKFDENQLWKWAGWAAVNAKTNIIFDLEHQTILFKNDEDRIAFEERFGNV